MIYIDETTYKIKKKDLIIVPVTDYSFKRACEEKFYAFPITYGTKQSTKYIAFYRVKPVMSVTHYAQIENVNIRPLNDFSARDRLIMFGHRFTNEIVVFELGPLIALAEPVKSGKISLQNRRYTTLDKLLKAKSLDDI